MKVLLTGSTGYIGRRLLPILVKEGHRVICPVRDKRRFDFEDFDEDFLNHVEVIEVDFSEADSISKLPDDIDAAYYLLHSMSTSTNDFQSLEQETARNFSTYIKQSKAKQTIYLGGIVNDDDLSEHLTSRMLVEDTLRASGKPVTVLRAGIIIGSGSASFEIIRDLVEKLPVMIAPKWLKSRCQPIQISNVLEYLSGALMNEGCFDKTFDIGGPDILTYKEMLFGYARVRGLKRFIVPVPVLTPRLSSLWLYFVTSTSYKLARNLVDSMKNEVICKDNEVDKYISIPNKWGYEDSLKRTLRKIEQKDIVSSWKDSFYDLKFNESFPTQSLVPEFGSFKDQQIVEIKNDPEDILNNIWEIGGDRGWYYGNFLWGIRGFVDQIIGGVGLRRGRRSPNDLKSGDSLDFWRVLYANKEERRLLLFAEMKLPGEAWLEFRIMEKSGHNVLQQTATFRPLGLAGRIYWYLMVPFHFFIFKSMAKNIVNFES